MSGEMPISWWNRPQWLDLGIRPYLPLAHRPHFDSSSPGWRHWWRRFRSWARTQCWHWSGVTSMDEYWQKQSDLAHTLFRWSDIAIRQVRITTVALTLTFNLVPFIVFVRVTTHHLMPWRSGWAHHLTFRSTHVEKDWKQPVHPQSRQGLLWQDILTPKLSCHEHGRDSNSDNRNAAQLPRRPPGMHTTHTW